MTQPVATVAAAPSEQVWRLGRLAYLCGFALVLTWLGGWWMKQAEVVVLATQITESVPPIPALGALFLLLAVNAVLRRWCPPLALSRQEILLIYAFCTVSVAIPACGSLRFVLSLITYPIYHARMSPELRLDLITPYIPDWLVPKEFALIRDLYLGRAGAEAVLTRWQWGNYTVPVGLWAVVPWREWVLPILAWTTFFGLFWLALSGMVGVFEKRWREHERLVFPLLYLPMRATEETPPSGLPLFWRDPLMWCGFALSAFYNALNMLNAFFPQMPAPGKFYDFGQFFTAPPLDGLRPLVLHYRPEVIGLGYLMPLEVAFTVWFSYALFKVEALIGRALGWQFAGFPFTQEQGLGAYLTMAVLLIYAARHYLRDWGRRLLKGTNGGEDALHPREAFSWLFIGVTGCLVFMTMAGMDGRVAALYFGLTLLVALVYARIRAEVGAPMVWLFPYYQHKKVILYTLGTSRLMGWGGVRSMTAFAVFTFLARGFFHSYTATQLENIQLGSRVGFSPHLWVRFSVAAVVVGVLMGFYFHLTPYYAKGAVNLREGGIWGHWISVSEYNAVVSALSSPLPPDVPRIIATIWGIGVTLTLGALRFAYAGSPFHPLGFAIAGAYGDLVWWSFLVVWVVKFFVLRYGGGRAYRRTVPLFLGFALGHYLTAGVIWGMMSATGKAPFQRYAVWFG
ncbi:hypothetical protein HRbin17_01648 [bacterium HR17]|uniref:Uncharacterized protein n=1 Tax=Candidatus Fervidibacter japonicus TaxID=2035412 RepID=A0A2H5XDB2_9BACT|nr:hypothetical protein HRbin17_01648 [bacterium HR17]